jgi:AraC-like DNA-binding protein
MSKYRQSTLAPDDATAMVIGAISHWSPHSEKEPHSHARHQLIYSAKGVIHVTTSAGRWILPPTKALWISGGIPHALLIKRPVDLIVLWIRPDAPGAPEWGGCNVVNVSPLVRELIAACAGQSWDYPPDSHAARLAQVLLEKLDPNEQAPLELPAVSDSRAARVADMLRADPADQRPLAELAPLAGASHRTVERLFLSEARMSFGRWRTRLRMLVALEQLANGESVSNVAHAVGYETPSSFIAAFRSTFGTTPTAYFR